MKLTDRLKKAAGLAVLPAATVLTATVLPLSAAHAQAQTPAAFLKVLTPRQNETLGTTRFNLDVQFKSVTNAPIVTAELWVDGVRWVRRDLDTPRRASVLSFIVDGSTLSSGAHNIIVKVFNADGDMSIAKVGVVAGSDQGETEAAWGGPEVQFVSPSNGKKVTGNVELLIDAKSHNGQNPYVTFYVDKKFKTLKNYPPYTFVWDTTNETNGVHEIEASGYLDSSNTTTTRRIRVFVDNPGGNTVRMREIPDLSKNGTTASRTVAKSLTIPLPKSIATPITAPTGEAHFAASTVASLDAVAALGLSDSSASVSTAKMATPRLSAPKVPTFSAPAVAKTVAVPAAKMVVAATPTMTSEPILSIASDVTALEPTSTVASLAAVTFAAPKTSLITPRIARPNVPMAIAPVIAAPVRSATVVPYAKSSITLNFSGKSVPPVHMIASKVTASPRVSMAAPVAHNVTMSVKPLQVAMDGQRIAFDVQPRVEAGMPIAPFRQIFEHTGGRVSWTKETQTVHAVNADREIVIGVGKKDAVVNGSTMKMDRAATLERGRTIVPLNFVGKALDMNVQYDPATGRLSITSKN